MENFTFYAPTYFAFGKDTENDTGKYVKRFGGSRVLLHYGGGSVIRSGLLDRVKKSLDGEGISYVELGGVKPNPRSGLVYEGIDLCRKEKVDFVLAVGGGSTIDSAKAIAAGAVYDGDFWDYYEGKLVEEALPIGTVITISAAGSEGSPDSVITKEEGMFKRGATGEAFRPKFTIMNPALTQTLPAYQTACGITDIMAHLYERYLTNTEEVEVTDRMIEGLLLTMIHEGPRVIADPDNYQARANIMWAGTLAHNDLTGCGTTGDWATHNIEHELSGLFDVSHGAGLAAVWGSWARYTRNENLPRFARFAHNVMGIDTTNMSDMEASDAGIKAMEQFFRSIGMPTDIHTLVGKDITDAEIEEMAQKCTNGDTTTIGGLKILHAADIVKIYQMAK